MKTLTLILLLLTLGCKPEDISGEKFKHKKEKNDTSYYNGEVVIRKIRDCEYVFWINGYGSDMEHYEGCNNPQHCK